MLPTLRQSPYPCIYDIATNWFCCLYKSNVAGLRTTTVPNLHFTIILSYSDSSWYTCGGLAERASPGRHPLRLMNHTKPYNMYSLSKCFRLLRQVSIQYAVSLLFSPTDRSMFNFALVHAVCFDTAVVLASNNREPKVRTLRVKFFWTQPEPEN